MNSTAPLQITEFDDIFKLQSDAYLQAMNPSRAERRNDLHALSRLLEENSDAIIAAINADYGCRSTFETRFAELLMAQDAINVAVRSLRKWMKPRKRSLSITQFPTAKAWTFPQPVGVVGIVVPWNFPIAMAFQPLIGAFAAGNRAMVKMSENSNHLALLLKELSPKYFPLDKLAFFEDGDGRGPMFTSLPFNHLFFTGSPATGKSVMANAARNLTPVTLELGGKSPAVISADYSTRKAVERVLWAKMINAGQICTNVDYLFLPEDKVQEFIAESKRWFNEHVPDINAGDYTAIIDQRSYDRLNATAQDAQSKGAELVEIYNGPTPDASRRIMAPRLVLNPTDDMQVMQREIFGPLLPILTYRRHQNVIDYINARPRPLAFYIFSDDRALQRRYLDNTISGGVGINEAVVQAGIHDLPFGGSGNSGMGHYHGYEGFLTFSKLRPVFRQGRLRGLDFLLPPYGAKQKRVLDLLFKLHG